MRSETEATAKRWAGKTVVILASGPSLIGYDVAHVEAWRREQQDRARVIVVCTTFRKALWADVLYAGDMRWWFVYGGEVERDFRGERWTCTNRLRRAEGYNWIESVDKPGLSTTPGRIHFGLNSGYQAINLAFLWGAARIILLGYDMQRGPNGESHHHGDHEGGLPNLGTIPEWAGCMEALAADLRAQGVEVINASRRTALKCFERMPIAMALPAHHAGRWRARHAEDGRG